MFGPHTYTSFYGPVDVSVLIDRLRRAEPLVTLAVITVTVCVLIAVGRRIWIRQNEASRRNHLRWILPKGSESVYLRDDHGGFHGDGCTFLTYTCSENELTDLEARIQQAFGRVWERAPLGWPELNTIRIASEVLQIPKELGPDGISPSLKCVHSDNVLPSDRRAQYFKNECIIDTKSRRVWYIEVNF